MEKEERYLACIEALIEQNKIMMEAMVRMINSQYPSIIYSTDTYPVPPSVWGTPCNFHGSDLKTCSCSSTVCTCKPIMPTTTDKASGG